MSTDPSPGTHQVGGVKPRPSRALLAVFLATLAVTCAALVVFGPHIRAAEEAERARVMAEEDNAFCGQLGAGPATGRYLECVAGLNAIRARYLQRSADLFF
jgi:hypothetical protein